MATAPKIRVLVVDDSPTARRILSGCLRSEPDIEVVGEASDALNAYDLIERCRPDLITLDIEMPKMDGLTFLRRVMQSQPIPVIVISSHTPPGSTLSFEALRAGAIDVMSKPHGTMSVAEFGSRLKQRIQELRTDPIHPRALPMRHRHRAVSPPPRINPRASGLVAIGASVGGPQALEFLLAQLPPNMPPIVIVQHMPAPFVQPFAERLNDICPMRVVVATAAEELAAGSAYLAPGDHHLIVEQHAGKLRARLNRESPVHYQRPAVDVLFHSLTRLRGLPIVGVLLTGMGSDGAAGMVALRGAGYETIAEDSSSCVVFGMPREAIARGGVRHILTLDQMPGEILRHFEHRAASTFEGNPGSRY